MGSATSRAPELPGGTHAADWPPHLLCVADLPCIALEAALDLAAAMKRDPSRWQGALAGDTIACFFDPPTTGMSVSTGAAADRLGLLPIVLPRRELELGDGEPVEDIARTLSITTAALFAHAVAHRTLRRVAAAASVPLINGLSDQHRPCQALADLLTLRERFGGLAGLAVAFVGDARDPTVHSLMEAGALSGMDVRVCCPPECRPSRLIEVGAETFGRMHGARLTVTHDVREAVAGADVVYTAPWSARRGEDRAAYLARLRPYQVGPTLMQLAPPGTILMHPLPAHRGEEVAAVVIDGRRSVVWQQAENRLPAEQAAIYALVAAHRARRPTRFSPAVSAATRLAPPP
jgi:ornithine carbamoyltransferase